VFVLQDDGAGAGLVDGFYVYLSPHGERRPAPSRHHVVHGSSVRHAVLSGLDADAEYGVRMQSFSETAGVLSKLSNAVLLRTPPGTTPSSPVSTEHHLQLARSKVKLRLSPLFILP